MSNAHKEPKTLRNKRYPLERWVIGRERHALLEQHRWYRNITGGWTHPRGMDFMSHREICSLTPAQLEYKLRYGSRATLPSRNI